MSDDGPSTPTVVGSVETDDGDPLVDLDRWVRLAEGVLLAEGVSGPAELALHFVDRSAMTELNIEHMGGDGPTDVLAFPIDAEADPEMAHLPRLLGDVVVAPAIAQRNANERSVTLDQEVALLVVHGVLHILGHDHAETQETAVMKAAEERLLDQLYRQSRPVGGS